MNQFNQTKKQALDLAQQINQKILNQKKELEKQQKKIIQQKLKLTIFDFITFFIIILC
jgi:hypothetical protein